MLSLIFLVYAAVHVAILYWGWRAWARVGRPTALTITLFTSTLLWYDNFRIGIGRFLGEGPLLYNMSIPAFVWHWSLLPLLVIAAGSLARLADLGWARSRLVMGSFCLAAVVLMALDVPAALGLLLGPAGPLPAIEFRLACVADTLRYTTTVTAEQFCGPDGEVFRVGPGPLAAIVMNAIMVGVGVALWIQRGWKWLAIGPGLMFLAAGSAPFWGGYALPVANFGEILFTLGVLATGVHFGRLSARTARPVPDAAAESAPVR